jgi:hypothetical protein
MANPRQIGFFDGNQYSFISSQSSNRATTALSRATWRSRLDERYDGTRGEDSVSNRSGFDEALYRPCVDEPEEGQRQIFSNQVQSQRDCNQGKEHGARIAPVCKNQRGKGQDWEARGVGRAYHLPQSPYRVLHQAIHLSRVLDAKL